MDAGQSNGHWRGTIEERVSALSDRLDRHDADTDRRLTSIETKVDDLRLWKARVVGQVSILSALGGGAVAMLARWLGG